MTEPRGYRGYIGSRPIGGERTAQHIQNLVIRDYARRHDLHYLLSATEYAMSGCFMILEQVLNEIDRVDGVICYSMFMLPDSSRRRDAIWRRVLDGGKSLHAALEGLKVETEADVRRIEDIWLVRRLMPHCLTLDARAW